MGLPAGVADTRKLSSAFTNQDYALQRITAAASAGVGGVGKSAAPSRPRSEAEAGSSWLPRRQCRTGWAAVISTSN
jgi:hypothetical protein